MCVEGYSHRLLPWPQYLLMEGMLTPE